jgi:cobalt-zinc-cadmium efflux system outer membrane protein
LPAKTGAWRTIVRAAALLGLLALAGCFYPVREKIDAAVCHIAKQPFDVQRLEAADQQPLMPPAENGDITPTAHHPEDDDDVLAPPRKVGPDDRPELPPELDKGLRQARRPLEVPPDLLPGGPPPRIEFGQLGAPERRERLQREFTPLKPPGPDYEGVPGPFGHPLTLAELQRIGLSSSPLIKQAMAAVESARGTAFQAGLPPNPIMGFETDTFGTTGGAGYVGGFIDQLIKTGGKLRLQRAVAAMDLRNAEVALRRAQMDLATRIRTYYFQLLVARENMRINRILVAFSDAVYEMQAGQARGKAELTIAPYEPMYLRALANMARTNLVTARNSYTAVWKQLAATLGLPGMPMTQVGGRVDMPVPLFDFHKVWLRVGRSHTDVATADNNLQEARFALMLAQVQPYPDVDFRFLVQKDYTGPPNEIAPSIAVSVPVPVWNRNQGGIAAAQANVIQMGEEPLRVRNDLYYRLSDAFNRYRSFHQNLGLYRDKILPDLVRVYNGVYHRYQIEGQVAPPAPPGAGIGPALQMTPPSINDVVVAQNLLATSIATYITNLGGMWQAVVDVTDLIQTHDMFQMEGQPWPTTPVPTLPDLEQLKPLLATHPCSPLPDPKLRGGDGSWPPAIPTRNNFVMPHADSQARQAPPAPPAAPGDKLAPQQAAMLPEVEEKERPTALPDSLSAVAPRKPSAVDPQLSEPPPEVPRR